MKHNQTKRKNKVKWLYHNYYVGGTYLWWGCWINAEPSTHNMLVYRRIGTFAERRDNILSDDDREYGVRVRGRRSPHTLPEPWDDFIIHARYTTKSWKHNSKRRKQWKYE